ncbi:MAG: primosomal protein N' [Bacteroidales bacterium]|nr:primosomal protein N' [Bacteroidales bacterium]
MPDFADIILPVPIRKLFTYSVPTDMQGSLFVGSRVVVQFGRKKYYSGIVFKLHDTKPDYETKPIETVVDSAPIVVDRQLALWQWMADYYMCSLGEVYRAALPSGLKLESESTLMYNSEFEADTALSPKMEQILNYMSTKRSCTISELAQYCSTFNPLPQIKKLLEMSALYISEELRDAYKPKTELFYALAPAARNEKVLCEWFDKLERAQKQLETLMSFLQAVGGLGVAQTGKAISRSELATHAEISIPALRELEKKGIIESAKQNVSRLGQASIDLQPPHQLSDIQQKAYDDILSSFAEHPTTLLWGVTSSGKTEIYIHLINKYIAEGKQVLYLLPEIALTTQITSRLRRHFGDALGVYHSKYNDAERVEVWNKLLNTNDFKVILGVRSSVMLPFRNLGLIIVDEEHESSYKQYDPAPRYNARDLSIMLAGLHGAKVLLGSATPSLESYNNATTGKYGFVELSQRFAGIEMPEIIRIDMREAAKRKKTISIFSFELKEAIDNALANKEQVILFQNRRGFAPYIECDHCAWIPKCRDCDVSMTYHKSTNQLICHYCSFTVQLPTVCPACGMPALRPQGYGTEKIEEEVKAVFPSARVVRMDLDTARSRKAYEKIITDFESYQYDILIGTQMISKGLDFARVSIVGIMNADNVLNMPDFRAYERSFQLISQVSGRAGRYGKRGKVFLQTRAFDNQVWLNVVANDFENNSRQQLAERQAYNYPPFYRLIYLTVKHKDYSTAIRAAKSLADRLRTVFGNNVQGPQEPPINRIATYFLQRIILKIDKRISPQAAKKVILDHESSVVGDQSLKGTVVQIDVDPY